MLEQKYQTIVLGAFQKNLVSEDILKLCNEQVSIYLSYESQPPPYILGSSQLDDRSKMNSCNLKVITRQKNARIPYSWRSPINGRNGKQTKFESTCSSGTIAMLYHFASIAAQLAQNKFRKIRPPRHFCKTCNSPFALYSGVASHKCNTLPCITHEISINIIDKSRLAIGHALVFLDTRSGRQAIHILGLYIYRYHKSKRVCTVAYQPQIIPDLSSIGIDDPVDITILSWCLESKDACDFVSLESVFGKMQEAKKDEVKTLIEEVHKLLCFRNIREIQQNRTLIPEVAKRIIVLSFRLKAMKDSVHDQCNNIQEIDLAYDAIHKILRVNKIGLD